MESLVNDEHVDNTTIEELIDDDMTSSAKLVLSNHDDGITYTEVTNRSDENDRDVANYDVNTADFVPNDKVVLENQIDGYEISEGCQSFDGVVNTATVCVRGLHDTVYVRGLHDTKQRVTTVFSGDVVHQTQVATDIESITDSEEEIADAIEAAENSTMPDAYLEPSENFVKNKVVNIIHISHAQERHKHREANTIFVCDEDEDTDTEEFENENLNMKISVHTCRHTKRAKMLRKVIQARTLGKIIKEEKHHADDVVINSDCIVDEHSDDDVVTNSECKVDEHSDGDVVTNSECIDEHGDDDFLDWEDMPQVCNTDFENCFESGEKDENGLQRMPIEKEIPFKLSTPQHEGTKINDVEDTELTIPQEETDEEVLELSDDAYGAQLPNRVYVSLPKVLSNEGFEEKCENKDYTDVELEDVMKTWRIAKENNRLEPTDCQSVTQTKVGKFKGVVYDVINTHSTVKFLNMCLQSNLSTDDYDGDEESSAATDEENYNEEGELVAAATVVLSADKYKNSGTNVEDFDASDNERINCASKSVNNCATELTKLSNIRFIGNDKCQMISVIVIPDELKHPTIAESLDSVLGMAFLENNDDGHPGCEDLISDNINIGTRVDSGTPFTDIEDLGVDDADTYITDNYVPNDQYLIMSRPQHEHIYIKDDRRVVSQVKVDNIRKDIMHVVQTAEHANISPEDVAITLPGASNMFGLFETRMEHNDDLNDTNSEMISKVRQKVTKHLSSSGPNPDGEESTVTEEFIIHKQCTRVFISSEDRVVDEVTDEEVRSDGASSKWSSLCISNDQDTNVEDLEVSVIEDIVGETTYPLNKPEIIHKVVVNSAEIYREQPKNRIGCVIPEPAVVHCAAVEFSAGMGIAGALEMECSSAEDFFEDVPCSDDAPPHEKLINNTQSDDFDDVGTLEDTAEMHIHESLLCLMPKADFHTDNESLDEVEGNRSEAIY